MHSDDMRSSPEDASDAPWAEGLERTVGSGQAAWTGRVLSVTEITRAIRGILELSFPGISVRGEVTNVSRPQSGHLYFSLVDDAGGRATTRLSSAQLACVLWRSVAQRLPARLENGQKVIVTGRIGVYEPRGTYQLIGDRVEPAGFGDLQRAFEELKERLRNEGLFRPERKRPLPYLPRRIGIVTSPRGAAIQDVLRVLFRRHPRAAVRIVPVRVQGEGAAEQMVAALDLLQAGGGQVDVILLTRGGGSVEDLWAFNDERLARAIALSTIPTVSAVGHEADFSIADFVADCRAQTPTKAAEILVPDVREIEERLSAVWRRTRLALGSLASRRRKELERLVRSRFFRRPSTLVEELLERCDDLSSDLRLRVRHRREQGADGLDALARRLEALNPRRVLGRGYAIVTGGDGHVVTDALRVGVGDPLWIEFARGRARVRVEEREAAESAGRAAGDETVGDVAPGSPGRG